MSEDLHSVKCRRLASFANDAGASQLVVSDSETLGGTPVFVGTRVPVRVLFEHLEAGDSLDLFLEDFPTVDRELAVAVLEEACAAIKASALSP